MLPEAAEELVADSKKVGGVEMAEVTWVHSWVFPGVARKVLHRGTVPPRKENKTEELGISR